MRRRLLVWLAADREWPTVLGPCMGLGLLLLVTVSAASAQQSPVALDVPGYAPAAVVPAHGPGPRPVVIALHGNFDRPEGMCAAWDRIVAGRAFVLCPRGIPRTDAPQQDRWELPEAPALAREVAAARRALAERYPGRVDEGPDVWVGFSQGAHRVAALALAEPARFTRVQLVEGGRPLWNAAAARRLAATDARVALVCAMRWCEQRTEALARTLRAGRVRVELERIPAAHHDLVTMEPAIRRTFEWLVAEEPRFAR